MTPVGRGTGSRRRATLQQQSPTYYGGAWAALGPSFLTSTVLGGCAPLSLG